MESNQNVIRLAGVTKEYAVAEGTFQALKNVSLEMERGLIRENNHLAARSISD